MVRRKSALRHRCSQQKLSQLVFFVYVRPWVLFAVSVHECIARVCANPFEMESLSLRLLRREATDNTYDALLRIPFLVDKSRRAPRALALSAAEARSGPGFN